MALNLVWIIFFPRPLKIKFLILISVAFFPALKILIVFNLQMAHFHKPQSRLIKIPVRDPLLVTFDELSDVIDIVQDLLKKVHKIEEALIDNFPVMQTALGDDCSEDSLKDDTSSSETCSDDTELVDLTGCDTSDYDPSKYYI